MRNLFVALAVVAVFAIAAAGNAPEQQKADSSTTQSCCGSCCETACE